MESLGKYLGNPRTRLVFDNFGKWQRRRLWFGELWDRTFNREFIARKTEEFLGKGGVITYLPEAKARNPINLDWAGDRVDSVPEKLITKTFLEKYSEEDIETGELSIIDFTPKPLCNRKAPLTGQIR